jgi:hypothetical protein
MEPVPATAKTVAIELFFLWFKAVLGIRIHRIRMFLGLPDPDPFVRVADGSFPFLINVLSGLK